MRSKTSWDLSLAACVWTAVATVTVTADPGVAGADQPVVGQVQGELQYMGALRDASERIRPLPENTPILRFGGEARGLPGTAVYRNEIDPTYWYFGPGAGYFMADDLTLAVPGCNMVYYDLLVYGGGGGAFDVHVELLSEDPVDQGCVGPFAVIPGTEQDFIGVPDGAGYLLSIEFDPSIAIPETLFMSATFSTDDAGWFFGEEAELGTTGNSFAYDPPGEPCGHYYIHDGPWAGFWANIRCDLEDMGACCVGDTCTETSDAGCGGSWQGPGTSCDPNPCGATTTCYLNDFNTASYDPYNCDEDQPWADDLTLCGPCEVAEYTITFFSTVSNYTVETVLLENIDPGTPEEPLDDLPGDPIAGTEWTFPSVASGAQALTAGPFYGINVPGKIWLSHTVDPCAPPLEDGSGPVLTGANNDFGDYIEMGYSVDGYFTWGGSEWTGWWDYGGFDPNGCPWPGEPCVPAGSFDIEVVCWGDIRGACCSTESITCVDDLNHQDCIGEGVGDRWTPDALCADLDPVCGTAACCSVDPQDPGSTICENTLPVDCAGLGGDPETGGDTCADLEDDCGIAACINGDGDCLDPAGNGTPTCNDRECCNLVCEHDPWCCQFEGGFEWDATCAAEAAVLCEEPVPPGNDNCWEAYAISEGAHEFTTVNTNTDGPSLPEECYQGAGDVLGHDVWYDYTPSDCGTVTVSLCGDADYDTREAAYVGCECPVTDDRITGCDDDGCGIVGGPSTMTFDVDAGTCYKLRVGGWETSAEGTGTFTITLDAGCVEWTPVTSDDPPDGAIDAGKPTVIDDCGVTFGWDSIEISGDGDASGVTAADFTVTVDPADEPPPSITTVGHPSSDDVTLGFDAAISTRHWTVITHNASGWSTRIGYLPADVNGDGTSSPSDILDLIDHLNGVITLPPWGTDVDRNAATNSADILTLIDLLNGAGSCWDPWNGETLP